MNDPKNKLSRKDLVVPALLIALSVVPMIGGAARLGSFSAPVSEENARFVASPVPVILHIAGASLYSLLGAFQFPRRSGASTRSGTVARGRSSASRASSWGSPACG